LEPFFCKKIFPERSLHGERVFNITGPCVPLLYTGEEIPYQFNNPEIELGTMYGILKEKEQKLWSN